MMLEDSKALNEIVAAHPLPDPAPSPDVETVAELLHAEHAREFSWMNGTHLSDPVPASECGNCQRWAKYAAAALRGAGPEPSGHLPGCSGAHMPGGGCHVGRTPTPSGPPGMTSQPSNMRDYGTSTS